MKQDFESALELLGGARPGKLSPDEAVTEHPLMMKNAHSAQNLGDRVST